MAFSESTVFEAVLIFKFGNDSVTVTAIRASISGTAYACFLTLRFHRTRFPFAAFWLSYAESSHRKHTASASLLGSFHMDLNVQSDPPQIAFAPAAPETVRPGIGVGERGGLTAFFPHR